MKVIFTISQILELREFKPYIKRFLLDCAYKRLFAEQPKLRWLPVVLCFIGATLGLMLACTLPEGLYIWMNDPMKLFVPSVVMGILAALGGFVSLQILVHRARRYLREMLGKSPVDLLRPR